MNDGMVGREGILYSSVFFEYFITTYYFWNKEHCVLKILTVSFFNFLFYIGVQPINNLVIVPGAEQSLTRPCNHSPPTSHPIQATT